MIKIITGQALWPFLPQAMWFSAGSSLSTATIGIASRTVTYSVPIGWLSGGNIFQKQQYLDPETGANWYTASGQTMGGQSFSGGVLDITGMVNPSGGGFIGWLAGLLGWGCGNAWNLIEWNWSYTNTNLAQAWVDAQGFLNYDLQVKIQNQQPYFFAGMNFRGRSNSNDSDFYTYGVSFIRPRQSCGYGFWSCLTGWDTTSDECDDLIPSNLFSGSLETDTSGLFLGAGTGYRYGLPAIVLWKRNTSGNFTWLAYRTLTTADGIVQNNGSGYRASG